MYFIINTRTNKAVDSFRTQIGADNALITWDNYQSNSYIIVFVASHLMSIQD